MLDSHTIKKIEDFVVQQPRSVQEIAEHIKKNWRTADRYVDEVEKSYGTISSKVFRGGTRGALKIVYWASVDNHSSSVFQTELEQRIIQGKSKEDFAPFDLYQHVDKKRKSFSAMKGGNSEIIDPHGLKKALASAKKQLIIFSGNLSFIQFKAKDFDYFASLEELVKRGVTIKVVCRVDFSGKTNIEKLLSLNFKYGKQLVEIHHRDQPLRGIIIDKDIMFFKEIQEPEGKNRELRDRLTVIYSIKDKEWIEWMCRIFWKMFSTSVDSNKRMEEINSIIA